MQMIVSKTPEYGDRQYHQPTTSDKNGLYGNLSVENSQICSFLTHRVQGESIKSAIEDFKLFFLHRSREPYEFAYKEINNLLIADQEQEFFKIITKSIYTILDGCLKSDRYHEIHGFFALIDHTNRKKRIRADVNESLFGKYERWLQKFLNSQDYITARLVLTRYNRKNVEHWSHYYSPFLLLAESTKEGLSTEQRRVCKSLSTELTKQFRLKLEMYLGRSQAGLAKHKIWHNPTRLTDSNLNILKHLGRRITAEYRPKAKSTIDQLKGLTYQEAKLKLAQYLCTDSPSHRSPGWLKDKIRDMVLQCNQQWDGEKCNRKHVIQTAQKSSII